jgi:sugar phosphate isomerase/epimerase
MFPGVSTQIFLREKLQPFHAVAVREAGFEAVEVYGFQPHFDFSDAAGAKPLARAFADEGVKINSLHAPFFDHDSGGERKWLSISHLNEKIRAHSLEIIERCVETALSLGSGIIVIHFGSGGDKNTHETVSRLFSSLVQVEDMTRGSGVAAAYENMGTPTSLCGYISHFIEKYEFRGAGVCLDVGHANLNEEPVSAVGGCGKLLINMHASDNNGHSDSHDIPFSGNIKWGALCRAINQSGYEGCFTMEPRFSGDAAALLERLKEAYEAILRAAEEEEAAPGEK